MSTWAEMTRRVKNAYLSHGFKSSSTSKRFACEGGLIVRLSILAIDILVGLLGVAWKV